MKTMTARPQQPTIDFDWTPEQWREAGSRMLEMAIKSSTNWDQRAPAPTTELNLAELFQGALPNGLMDIDQLMGLVEEKLSSGRAFNGHPIRFAYIHSAPLPPIGGWRPAWIPYQP